MARMRPELEVAGCRFSHKEAGVDPFDPHQLWDVTDEPLDLLGRANRGFAAAPHPRQFVGHYHRWWAATPQGQLEWSSPEAIPLTPDRRYFVVVAAVFDGWCATFDTEASLLRPLPCGAD